MFGVVLIVYLIFMLISLAIPVAAYIMTGIGLSRMARACNLRSPWLAWVPIGDLYTIGSIAEIGASRGGKKSMAYRKILPGITCGFLALFVAFFVLMFGFIFSNPELMDDTSSDDSTDVGYVSYSPDDSYDYGFEIEGDGDEYEVYVEDTDAAVALLFLLLMGFYLLIFLAAIILAVFQYLALWHVFRLFDESNAVLYLLLSIFLSAMPIIYLILCRKTPDLPSPEPVNVQPMTVAAYAPVAPVVSAPVAPVQPAIEAPDEQTTDTPPSDAQI